MRWFPQDHLAGGELWVSHAVSSESHAPLPDSRVGRPKPPGLCPRIKTRPKLGLGRVALTGLGRPKLPKLA